MAKTTRIRRQMVRATLPSAIAVVAAFGATASARADVIAVGADGSTTLRTGAGTVRWTGGDDDGNAAAVAIELPDDVEIPAGAVLSATSRAPAAYVASVAAASARYAISPALLEAVAWNESRWRPRAVSRVGAVGLTQLMPATARALGVDPADPRANLEGGARYLRMMLDRFDGDVERALAAYNAGPARVARTGGVPGIAETRGYVAAVLSRLSSTPTGD